MDYREAVRQACDAVERDDVEAAVMGCLRIARNLRDHVNAAVFLQELSPDTQELKRVFWEDTSHLDDDARKLAWDVSVKRWIDGRDLGFSLGHDKDGDELRLIASGIGEMQSEIEQKEQMIKDLALPPGMDPYDLAAFTDRYQPRKNEIRLRISALHTVRARIKTRCHNYLVRIERQLDAQDASEGFLHRIQTDVNNYFREHAEDVYRKLLKATGLVHSEDGEDASLLLTEVRRVLHAAADHFYPPVLNETLCADGKTRLLGPDEFLNRLEEYIRQNFGKGKSRKLLDTELQLMRRLCDLASKGVHADVLPSEGKQGCLALYMFLFNLVCREEHKGIGNAT